MSALKCWARGAVVLLALAQGSHAETTVSQANDPQVRLDMRLDALFAQERAALGALSGDHVARITQPPALRVTPPAPGGTVAALAAAPAADAAPALPSPLPAPATPAKAPGLLAALFAPRDTAPRTAAVADAVFDERWLATQPMPDRLNGEMECLATAIYFEARGESAKGQAAVAEVILNRVGNPSFPGTICAVVNQRGNGGCQFSYTCDGRSDTVRETGAWRQAAKIAAAMIAGAPRQLTNGATHFHTPDVRPDWARRFTRTTAIGRHIFYRQPLRTASN